MKTYENDEVIDRAYTEVTGLKRTRTMKEDKFAEMIRAKARRCGSVFSERSLLKSISVDGLHRRIQAWTRNHLWMNKYLTFSDITQYAMHKLEDERNQTKPLREIEYPVGKKSKTFGKIQMMQEEETTSAGNSLTSKKD